MNVNKVLTKDYKRNDIFPVPENKPNSNPIQTQYKPNTNPIQTLFQRQKKTAAAATKKGVGMTIPQIMYVCQSTTLDFSTKSCCPLPRSPALWDIR